MGDGQQIRGEEPGVGSDARQSPIPPSSLLEPKEAVAALAGMAVAGDTGVSLFT